MQENVYWQGQYTRGILVRRKTLRAGESFRAKHPGFVAKIISLRRKFRQRRVQLKKHSHLMFGARSVAVYSEARVINARS